MIATPLGLRLDPARPVRDQIREAARIGAKGVVIDAIGDLSPDRLSETGRRELRHLLRSVETRLIAVSLPTRRPFDTIDQLDDRLRRAQNAFRMAYELGTALVLARLGAVPQEADAPRREVWISAARELGRRADHQGIRLAIETGPESGSVLRPILDTLDLVGLAASIDPSALLQRGIDPASTTRELGHWVAHAYASDAVGANPAVPANPRGFGFPPGALDWEEYLGALEEVNYRGFLTVWPDPARNPAARFTAIQQRLNQI
jgi:sugar phosphate isomerase/epimerase